MVATRSAPVNCRIAAGHFIRIDRADFFLVAEVAHRAAMRSQFEAMARERELRLARARVADRHRVRQVFAGVHFARRRNETPVDERAGREIGDFRLDAG